MNKLSADLFEEIIATLRSDRSLRGNEKRNRPRVGLRSSLDITVCAANGKGPQHIKVWVRDVSSEGMGLVSSASIQQGLEFIASFERSDREPLRVQYSIAYCKALSKGLYSIGARLLRVLPAEGAGVVAGSAIS